MIDFNLLQEYLKIYFKNLIEYIKKYNTSLFYISLFVVILVSIALYISFKVKNKNGIDKMVELDELGDSNSINESGKTATVYMFSTDWCPICNHAQPEWNKFEREIKKKYDFVNPKMIDCEDIKNQKLVKKYDIKGYPTIKLVYNNKVHDYEARVNKERLEQFVTEIIEDN